MSAVTHEFSGNLLRLDSSKSRGSNQREKYLLSTLCVIFLKEYVCTESSVKRWHPSSNLNLHKARMHSAKRARKLIRFRGIVDALKWSMRHKKLPS